MPIAESMAACDAVLPQRPRSDQMGCPLACSCSGGRVLSPVVAFSVKCVLPCGRTLCEVGQACRDGRCVDELCPMSCDPGDVCLDGQCEQRPYLTVQLANSSVRKPVCPEMPVCGFVRAMKELSK